MPNLRSSPAADISREFQTGLPPDIRTRPYISFEGLNLDSSDTVLAGEAEIIDILAPAGYIYELINANLFAPFVSGATSGSHYIVVYALGIFGVMFGYASYSKDLQFNNSYWHLADIDATPPSDQLLALQSCRADEDSPITIRYNNDTDADQTQLRNYRFMIKKVRV